MTADVQTPVKIHLTTNFQLDGEEETFEMILFGRYYRKRGTAYLKYDEVQEEGTVHTLVKVGEKEAAIFRKGMIHMRMKFRLNEQKDGSHESEYGSLLLSTFTNKLAIHELDHTCEGTIHLGYDLYMQGTHAGKYDMKIQYWEDKGNL